MLCASSMDAQNARSLFSDSTKTDLVEILVKALKIKIKEKAPDRKRISFSVVPTSTTSVEGDRILVSSINAAFTLGHRDSTNVSNIYLLPYFGSTGVGFGTKINLWTAGNNWNFPAEARYNSLGTDSYGLGTSSEPADRFRIEYNNIRTYFSANRRVKNYLYAGLGLNYDRYYNVKVKETPVTPSDFEKYGTGSDVQSFSTGVTFNALYDDRKNSINPDFGHYMSAIYRINPSFLQNKNTWTSLYLDYRQYARLPTERRQIVAIWAFYWGSFGQVPYFNLPGTELEFGTRSGRGYAQGRFRGRHMLYFEGEYRFDLTKNGLFGGVLFVNTQSLSEPDDNTLRSLVLAGGFGARVKFNKESNTNLTLDFGFGKDSFQFTIGLGEFF